MVVKKKPAQKVACPATTQTDPNNPHRAQEGRQPPRIAVWGLAAATAIAAALHFEVLR